MKNIILVIWACAIVFLIANYAYSQGPTLTPLTYINNYNQQAVQGSSAFFDKMNSDVDLYYGSPFNKLGNGILNIASSWTDVPYEVGKVSIDDNILTGMTFGLAAGLANGFIRLSAGVIDAATFGIPPYDDVLMEPEYEANQPAKDFRIVLFSW